MPKAKRTRSQSEVELNLAAMLDMAFQLLTFFILTYRPPPIEGQISLRLPPPEARGRPSRTKGPDRTPRTKRSREGLNTLTISVFADPRSGELPASASAKQPVPGHRPRTTCQLRQRAGARPGNAVRPGNHPGQPVVPLRRVDEGDRRLYAPDARRRQEALEAEFRGYAVSREPAQAQSSRLKT